MARRFRKLDIERHTDHGYGTYYPAVNVKVQSLDCTIDDVAQRFGCTEDQAEKALGIAWDSECEQFWAYWQDTTGDLENGLYGSPEYAHFPGYKVMVYAAGRSGGWLIVEGLPPVEEWDAILVSRWGRFVKDVMADIEYRQGKECLLAGIEANEWYKPHSEQYNFHQNADRTVCIADVKADVIDYAMQHWGFVPALP